MKGEGMGRELWRSSVGGETFKVEADVYTGKMGYERQDEGGYHFRVLRWGMEGVYEEKKGCVDG